MNACAVTADLNSYMARVDREDAISEAASHLVDKWLTDPEKVAESVESTLAYYAPTIEEAFTDALIGPAAQRASRAESLLACMEKLVWEHMDAIAPDAVEADWQASRDDAAEAAAESRRDMESGW